MTAAIQTRRERIAETLEQRFYDCQTIFERYRPEVFRDGFYRNDREVLGLLRMTAQLAGLIVRIDALTAAGEAAGAGSAQNSGSIPQ